MLRLHIANKLERRDFDHLSGPLEIGRGPERDGISRCTVKDNYVSGDHVRLQEIEYGRVRVRNLSKRNSIRLADNTIIPISEERDLAAPVRLTVGETLVEIETVVDPIVNTPLDSIAPPPSRRSDTSTRLSATRFEKDSQASLLDLGASPGTDRLMEWFETLIAVQRAAAGSPEFYQQTAEAVVRMVGLDRGLVILRAPTANPRWMVQARFPPDATSLGREFSLTILDKVLADRRTYFQSAASASSTESLQGIEAVVASPIFGPQDEVVGFVYGSRHRFIPQIRGMGIGPLEAQVIQMLASAVGVGLARQQQEAEASRARIQFEQFFSAELAQELQKNPAILKGQQREITVLFTDVRGFSRLAEKLNPQDTCAMMSDVMDRLTDCIRRFDGVVVDYAGDGIFAMWNAPMDQPDHAARACRAALAMLTIQPQINTDWTTKLGLPLQLGIGLNTGLAMCGNTGSKIKFKYGPLGHTVNLGSRVEGATKLLGVPLLVSGTTRAQLPESFAVRRVCRARVVNVQGPVDFYELYGENVPPEWHERCKVYERALQLYEAGHFGEACQALSPLISQQEGKYDIPSLNLLTRAVEALKNPPTQFDGIYELSSK